jgi:hypothetical protein
LALGVAAILVIKHVGLFMFVGSPLVAAHPLQGAMAKARRWAGPE